MPKTSCVVPPLPILSLPSPSPDTPRVSVFHLTGASNTQPSHPHTHSFFELLFVEDGEGWHRIGERQVWAKPGDLFLIAPGEVHDPGGLDGATKWIIAFRADAPRENPDKLDEPSIEVTCWRHEGLEIRLVQEARGFL